MISVKKNNNKKKKNPHNSVFTYTYKENAKTFTRKVDDKLMTSLKAGTTFPALKGCGQ